MCPRKMKTSSETWQGSSRGTGSVPSSVPRSPVHCMCRPVWTRGRSDYRDNREWQRQNRPPSRTCAWTRGEGAPGTASSGRSKPPSCNAGALPERIAANAGWMSRIWRVTRTKAGRRGARTSPARPATHLFPRQTGQHDGMSRELRDSSAAAAASLTQGRPRRHFFGRAVRTCFGQVRITSST